MMKQIGFLFTLSYFVHLYETPPEAGMRIDFLGLEAFVSIADRGNFNRAAAHLNLSQTALSHRVKKLEEDLGVRLLMRTTRQVALTPEGLDLLPRARHLIEEMTHSLDRLRKKSRNRHEQVAIGCLPTVATHYLPVILGQFNQQAPELLVRVFDRPSAEIADLVQSGQAEFGITLVSANRWDLEITPLLRESYLLVARRLDRRFGELAQGSAIGWSDIESEALIRVSAHTGNRIIIDDALGSRREQMNWRYEVEQVSTAISMVRAGVGLTIVPRLAIDLDAMPDLVAFPLRNPAVTRTLGIVARRDASPTPGGERLRRLIENHMRAGVRDPELAAESDIDD
jgi:DNA-binding transcriptional LysR family regulator